MRYFITGLCCSLFLLFSCDKRKDLFKDENVPSGVSINLLNNHSPWSSTISGNHVMDTLKVGSSYSFAINLNDESPNTHFEFSGNGSLLVDGIPFISGDLPNGSHSLIWNPDTTGIRSFSLEFIDTYDQSTIWNFDIYVFINWVPHIDWVLVDVDQLDPYEKKIIVNGLDGDYLYGGEIIYYQYIIDSDTTNYPLSSMNYIFPGAGSYDIGVRAMDSNYEWSNIDFISNVLIE